MAEKEIALTLNSGKGPGSQGTSLGGAENPPHFGLDAEGTEDRTGAETGKEPAEKEPG